MHAHLWVQRGCGQMFDVEDFALEKLVHMGYACGIPMWNTPRTCMHVVEFNHMHA